MRQSINKLLMAFAISSIGAHSMAQAPSTSGLSDLLERASRSIEASVQNQSSSVHREFSRFKERGDEAAFKNLALMSSGQDGHVAANYMGCIYALGIRKDVDLERAERFFLRGAAKSPLAAYNLGLIYASRDDQDRAFRAMQAAWSRGGIEQAGAWVMTMAKQRELDIRQIANELDFINSPVGQNQKAIELFEAGDYRGAIAKLVGPISFGLQGASALKAKIYLEAHLTSPSKFFDWAEGLAHLYIEMGVSGPVWGLPERLPSSRVGASRQWFGDVYHQIEAINNEAYTRASQWFSNRPARPDRYSIHLCEADRIFDRAAYRMVNQ